MYLTAKQLELMRVINSQDGIDLDEILDAVRYLTTKESLQFSIRALIKHGLIEKRGIEKRRGRSRMVIIATKSGQGYRKMERLPDPTDSDIVYLGQELEPVLDENGYIPLVQL